MVVLVFTGKVSALILGQLESILEDIGDSQAESYYWRPEGSCLQDGVGDNEQFSL